MVFLRQNLSHCILCKSVPEESQQLRNQSKWSQSWAAGGAGHTPGGTPPSACFPMIATWPKGMQTWQLFTRTDYQIYMIKPYFARIVDVRKWDIGDRKLKKFAEGSPAFLHVKYKELLGWNQSPHLYKYVLYGTRSLGPLRSPTSSWRPSWHLSFLVTLLQEAVLSRRVLTNSRTLMARVCLIGKCYLKNFDLLEL